MVYNSFMSDHQNQHVDTLKRWLREGSESMAVVGLSGSAQSYFFARVLADLDRPCLIVLPERKGAVRLYRELQFFMGAESEEGSPHLRLHQFLPYDMSPLTGLSPRPKAAVSWPEQPVHPHCLQWRQTSPLIFEHFLCQKGYLYYPLELIDISQGVVFRRGKLYPKWYGISPPN